MKTKNVVMLFLLFLVLSVLAACTPPVAGVFDISIQPVSLAADESTPEALRQVALAFLDSRYNLNWQDFIQFLTTPCTTADGLGGPPKCEAGVEEGTPVTVFPLSGPEGHFVTPETIDLVFNFGVKSLFAVYKVSSDAYQETYWPAGEYALLFERDQNDVPFPVTVFVEDGKIVRIAYHFGVTAEEQLQTIPVEQVIIPPKQVETWIYPNGK